MMERRLAARLPMQLFTLETKTGQVTTVLRSTDWLNHVQFSPTDPALLMWRGRPHDLVRPADAAQRGVLAGGLRARGWASHVVPPRPWRVVGPFQRLAGRDALRRRRGGPTSVAAPGNGQATFTPDMEWIVFRSNMLGPTHVYAVAIAK